MTEFSLRLSKQLKDYMDILLKLIIYYFNIVFITFSFILSKIGIEIISLFNSFFYIYL